MIEVNQMIKHSKPLIERNDLKAVERVLQSGELVQGEKVLEFEKAMAKFIGKKYAVAVSSGTAALHLALLSLGIKENDEIIMPSFVCNALLNAAQAVRAKPVIVDITEKDFNICFECVKKKISKRSKAVILPYLFGMPIDAKKFKKFGIKIIEDCAQSIGAKIDGKRKVGSFGDISIFSFYATKVIASGEGGMLLTDDKKIAEKAKSLRDYTSNQKNELSFNYKMTDLESALGLNQLKKLSKFLQKRKSIAKKYNKAFCKLKSIELPECNFDKKNIHYRYIVLAKNRNTFVKKMRQKGIACGNGVAKPIHRILKLKNKNFPATEKVVKQIVSIPIYPALKNSEISKIIKVVREVSK